MGGGGATTKGEQEWPFDFGSRRPAAGFRIRSVTLGMPLRSLSDMKAIDRAAWFLDKTKQRLADSGYEIQTLRVATPPLWRLTGDGAHPDTPRTLAALERHADERGLLLGVGPLTALGEADADTVRLACDIAAATQRICFSLPVAEHTDGPDRGNIAIAGDITAALAQGSDGGEAAFRFAAAACCPAGIPFFPAAFHDGPSAVSIALEAADLIADTIADCPKDPATAIASRLDKTLLPLETLVSDLARQDNIAFRGIDTSPAPMRRVSIAGPLEHLIGAPFGAPGTLAACAAVTVGLKRSTIRRCGFSGLMLPLLEDNLLARRAAEGRYGLQDLLSYSSVCGTGLDTVPIPGDSSPKALAAVIGDMAALAATYDKPLVARLLPVPKRAAGDPVSFTSPFLASGRVLPLDGRLPPS